MKPIPFRNSNLCSNDFHKESKLIFFTGSSSSGPRQSTERNYTNERALESRNGEPDYLNPVRLTQQIKIGRQEVSLLDFILHNTLNPDYVPETGGSASGLSNRLYNIPYTRFKVLFEARFPRITLPANLNLVIDQWTQRFPTPEKQRNLEIRLLQPTNINILTYKFQTPAFSYNGSVLWGLLTSQSTEQLTQRFVADDEFAMHVLRCINMCEPDTLLASVLRSIIDDLQESTNESAQNRQNREEACKTLAHVCSILVTYSTRSTAATNFSASASELTNPESGFGMLSSINGLPAGALQNFQKLSGAEKAFSLIGALVIGRALGNNIPPKARALFKTLIIGGVAAPIVTHLGTKLQTGRSYMETRKINSLLGGDNAARATTLIGQICGFSEAETRSPANQENIEGFIDSLVRHDNFAGLKFRDVIHAFKSGGNSQKLILGSISSDPKVKQGLEVVIPKLIEKFEINRTADYDSTVTYHFLLQSSSSKTFLEGMFMLMRNSSELEDLLNSNSARDEVNTSVTRDEIQTVAETDANKPLVEYTEHTRQLDGDIDDNDRNHMLRMQIESLENLPVNHPYSSLFAVNPNNSIDSSSVLNSSVDVTGARYVSFELDIRGKNVTEVQNLLTAARDRVKAIYPDSNKWNSTLVFSGTNRAGTKLFIGYSVAFEYTEDQLSGSERFRSHINSNLKSLISDRYPHPYGLIYRDLFENIPLSQRFISILSGEATRDEINAMLPQEAQLNQNQVISLNTLLEYSNSLGLLDSTKGMISKLLEFNPRRFVSILNDPNTSTLGKINAIASAIRTSSESHTNILKERTTIYEDFDDAGEEYLRTQTGLNTIERRLLATQFRFAAVLFTLKRHGVENFNMTTLFGSEYDLTVAGFTQYITAYTAQYKSSSTSAVSRVISTTPVRARRTPSSGGGGQSGGSSTPPETQRTTITEADYRLVTSPTRLRGQDYIKVMANNPNLRSRLAPDFDEVTAKPSGADSRYTYYRRKTAAAPQSGTRSNPPQPTTQPRQAASGFTNTRDSATQITVKPSYSNSELNPKTFYKLNVNPQSLRGLTSVYRITNLQNDSNGWTFTVEKIL